MASEPGWLIDKSALVRVPDSPDAELWFGRVERGLVRVASPTILEMGYSAQSAATWDRVMDHPPLSLCPPAYLTPLAEARAIAVQRLLAERGQHRAPSPADLLIAAVAELTGLTVLHVDKDFDLIAAVTGQPVERLRLGT
jgi:predicted nucleic acid-binding protein